MTTRFSLSPLKTVVVASVMLVSAASTAQAQVAKFKQITDAVPSKFFDAATSAPDPSNPNKLIIGFNSGFDPTTFVANDFRASSLPFSNRAAMDTISFTVKAPTGYYISKITYTQRGTGFTGRTSSSMGGATWVVAGHAASLGVFTSDPGLSGTADVAAMKLTSVPVSITVSLFASTGSVAVTSADVRVQLVPQLP
jgi:hypothetical protein